MRKQKGVTLTGLIIGAIVFVLLAVFAFKVVPVLLEYKAIQRQMQSMAEDPSLRGASRAQYERAWAMRSAVESFKSPPDHIDYERQGDQMIISAEYSVKVPLFYNVSLWFDFKPTTATK